ncbi:MAG: DUF4097 family beta strand repeat protein, partial [Candidatus Aminicenantes bacterium]|nr:DUF4097 family beta strand repeat protein [Candidatus Aminicenantes bacterium]
TYTYDADEFTPVMEAEAGRLTLREDFHGHGNHNGRSHWSVTVPATTSIVFSSASGDGEIYDLNASVTAKTASGDVKLKNIRGDVNIRSASGDISLESIKGGVSCYLASGELQAADLEGDVQVKSASGQIELKGIKGSCQAKTASGDLDLSGLVLQGPAVFSSASGDVAVTLSGSNDQDMSLSSASGDVTLDFNGQPFQGSFEFRVSKDHGDIVCPVAFDRQEEIEHGESITLVKSFARGAGPKITLKSAIGTVTLKK